MFVLSHRLVSFSFPISHKNHNLGQCSKHHEYDPSSIPNHFLYPNTIGTLGINKYDVVSRIVEESCSSHEHIIQQEDPVKSLKFGDSPNSYVILNLEGNKHLKQRFNLTFSFRTYYPNGLLFQGLVNIYSTIMFLTQIHTWRILFVCLYSEKEREWTVSYGISKRWSNHHKTLWRKATGFGIFIN